MDWFVRWGGGDDPASNGHVESEINQIKRRVRLLLRSSGQDVSQWPNALRYAVEERMRSQLEKLGVPVMCMIPYASKVLVKRKRWHDAGVLAAPYVEGELLCPSPQMSHGWVVKTVENRILHVREAIVPSSVGEEVALELQESPPKRIEVEEFPLHVAFMANNPQKKFLGFLFLHPKLMGIWDHRSMLGRQRMMGIQSIAQLPQDIVMLKGPKSLGFSLSSGGGVLGSSNETEKTETEKIEAKHLGEPLGKCLGSKNDDTKSLALDTQLGSKSLERDTQLGSESLGECLGSRLGKEKGNENLSELVRIMKLEDVDEVWNREHEGLTRELQRVLQFVPDDGLEGLTYGVIVELLQGKRDMLEQGLMEVNKLKKNHVQRLCAVGRVETEKTEKTEETVETPNEANEVLQTVTMSLGDVVKTLMNGLPPWKPNILALQKKQEQLNPLKLVVCPPTVWVCSGKTCLCCQSWSQWRKKEM